MRPPDAYQGVDETLQADVMRFMAIIAFCLIAILSLVRSLEPPQQVGAEAEPVAVAEPQPDVGAISRSRTPGPNPAQAERLTQPPLDAVAVAPEASAPARPEPERILKERPLATAGSLEAPPAPVREARPTLQPTPPAPAAERGLSLRFASDQDFLRLVNRGEIQVFAFRDGEVLSVSADFRFEKAPAPGRLHELLPETIPDLMAAALSGATNGAAYRWGVAIPPRMARQIQAHLERGATGELIIDRFGEVRHHGA